MTCILPDKQRGKQLVCEFVSVPQATPLEMIAICSHTFPLCSLFRLHFHACICGTTDICATERTSRNRTISMQRCVRHWSATHTHTHTHILYSTSRAATVTRYFIVVYGSVFMGVSSRVTESGATETTLSMQWCVRHWSATHTHTNPLQHQSRRNCDATVHRRVGSLSERGI